MMNEALSEFIVDYEDLHPIFYPEISDAIRIGPRFPATTCIIRQTFS